MDFLGCDVTILARFKLKWVDFLSSWERARVRGRRFASSVRLANAALTPTLSLRERE
jgi:hypothetical protein